MAFVIINQNFNQNFQWTVNASLQLIQERRNLHDQYDQFERVVNNHLINLWNLITNRTQAATGFIATANQCRQNGTLLRGL